MRPGTIRAFMLLATLLTAPAWAEESQFGIDQSNLSAQSEQVRVRVIAGVRTLGASWFRDGFSSRAPHGNDDFVSVVRLAKQQNLRMLEVVLPVTADFDDPAGAENAGPDFGKRCGWPQGSRKLSRINLDKFAHRLRNHLDALKAAKLTIDAFEIGNEFDWICFNGDVPDGHEATREEFMAAVRAYARFLKTAAGLIQSQQYYPGSKIITFGLAHASDKWDRPMHHFADPARMIAQLRNLDGFDYLDNPQYHVDGYGEHIYPSADAVAAATEDILRRDAGVLGRDRPLWITEWGLDLRRFPNKSGQSRSLAMTEFYATIAAFRGASFGPIFYFAYEGAPGGSGLTTTDGTLLPDARAAIPGRR
jgi:hypothetical protein